MTARVQFQRKGKVVVSGKTFDDIEPVLTFLHRAGIYVELFGRAESSRGSVSKLRFWLSPDPAESLEEHLAFVMALGMINNPDRADELITNARGLAEALRFADKASRQSSGL